MFVRRLWGALSLALLLDLAFIVVTKASLVGIAVGLAAPVAVLGFACRGLLFVIASVAYFRGEQKSKWEWGALALLASAVLSLAHFHFQGRRISGDGLMYYVYLRSIAIDGDLDLANEYEHYGIANRDDLAMPTATGYRRSIFSVGPAWLLLPFFWIGQALVVLFGPTLGMADVSGYGPWHVNASAFGSFSYGIVALALMRRTLRRWFDDFAATTAVIAICWATFHEWYIAIQPLMSHATSAFMAALVVWLWLRVQTRAAPGLATAIGWGVTLGLAMSVRWQNGIFLFLPIVTGFRLLRQDSSSPRPSSRVFTLAVAVALGVGLGVAPQLYAWKAIFGTALLSAPPHGADFLRLDHPFVLNTLFSSRHGLLSWTPIFWLGFGGLFASAWRQRDERVPLAILAAVTTYVNMCSGDWWAGGSFSNRRFDSALPLLAPGFATAFVAAVRFVEQRRRSAVVVLATLLSIWNAAVAVSRKSTADVARSFFQSTGFPTTWPASWIFAWRHRTAPGAFDLAQGQYLFYRQGNLQGRIDLGRVDGSDASLLLEGFSPPVIDGRFQARRLDSRGRVLAPLDIAETLDVGLRMKTPEGAPQASRVEVFVNEKSIGSLSVGENWNTEDLEAPVSLWHREMNEVTLVATSPVLVDVVIFKRRTKQ